MPGFGLGGSDNRRTPASASRVDTVNIGYHMGTDAHGPQGGACQHSLTNLNEHKKLELTYGGALDDVILETERIH